MNTRPLIYRIPYASFLGVEVEQTAEGLVCVLPFRDENIGNPRLPALHGGVVGAFLELTARLHMLGEGVERTPKPINFSVNYLRSAAPVEMRGRGIIVKHGRRIANVRVEAWQDDAAKTVAVGVGTFLL